MADIDARAIVTLIFFFVSIVFVIQPFSISFRAPLVKKVTLKLGLITAPILAIAILWASQCIGATQIRDGIVGTDGIKPYNILILFISLAYMAITLDVTGILQAAAFWVSNKGGSHGRRLYFYFYVLLTFISMILGNDPVILSGTVFLVYYTAATSLDPIAWLISEFAAANTASMVLFVGNPTNVVICEGFRINNAAFTAYTILPFLACSVACYLALMFQFRSEKHVPRKLDNPTTLNPRDVLRDPVGAWFGSLWLLTCLIVVIVLSFLHIDVWKIVLPFAGGKFIFDIVWDSYRYKTHRIPTVEEFRHQRRQTLDDIVSNELKRAASRTDEHGHERRDTTGSTQPEGSLAPLHRSMANQLSESVESSRTLNRSPSPQSPTNRNDPTNLSPRSASPKSPAEPNSFSAHFPSLYSKYAQFQNKYANNLTTFSARYPTISQAFPRLPFGLIPFAFSQFILIEGLAHQGWIDVFSVWFLKASNNGQMIPTVWLIGVLGVILCNIAGTNIGATILLTKIVRAAELSLNSSGGPTSFPPSGARGAALALAVSSNIGAVSWTFSASLAGLLWDGILRQKGIVIGQLRFALWNSLPLLAMTAVGLAVVTAEMVVLYH